MTTDQILKIIEIVGSFSWLVIGLLIKNSLSQMKLSAAKDKADLLEHQNEVKDELKSEQTRIKEELVEAQTKVRAELVEHNNLLSQNLAVHIATDEVRFKQLENASHIQVNVQK